HLPDPDVRSILDGDPCPGVVFVMRVALVERGHAAQVLHSDLPDSPRPGVTLYDASAMGCVEGCGQRCIEFDRVAVDLGDNSVPTYVNAARPPVQIRPLVTGREPVHSDGGDPLLRSRMLHDNGVADVQSFGRIEPEGVTSNRNVPVGNRANLAFRD